MTMSRLSQHRKDDLTADPEVPRDLRPPLPVFFITKSRSFPGGKLKKAGVPPTVVLNRPSRADEMAREAYSNRWTRATRNSYLTPSSSVYSLSDFAFDEDAASGFVLVVSVSARAAAAGLLESV